MPYGDSYSASSEAPWWGNYYQSGQSQDQPASGLQSSQFWSNMLGVPAWMAHMYQPMRPQPAQSWPQQAQQAQQAQQMQPLPYYDNGQNANAQMQPLPYAQSQQQPDDPVAAWMQQHQQRPKRKQPLTREQQMQQYGMSMLSPQFPRQGGGQGGQMPYGLAPLYWAPTQNQY
jgi:hypothetical protein